MYIFFVALVVLIFFMIIKKMISLRTNSKTYTLVTRFGESLPTMNEIFAYFMYHINRFSEIKFDKFDEFTSVYDMNDNYAVVKYTDNYEDARVYNYKEHFDEINTQYKQVATMFDHCSNEELSNIHDHAERKNMSPILYFETYHKPNCLIHMKDCDVYYELKVRPDDNILEVIAERLAYFMHKILLNRDCTERFEKMAFPPNNFDIKYRVGDTWTVYDYNEHLDEINSIYNRFTEVLSGSQEELTLIEKFTEDYHYNDPLALCKQCHNCGSYTPHYNGACNKHCTDLIYSWHFECRYGEDCPLCPFIQRS